MYIKKIIKNAGVLIISQNITKLIGFFQTIILIRYLGKTDFGLFSTVFAVPGMFIILTHMGINTYMLRKVSSDRTTKREELSKVLSMRFFLSIAYLLFLYIFCTIFGYESETKNMIIITATGMFSFNLISSIAAVFRAYENFLFEAIIDIIHCIFLFFVVLLSITFNIKLVGIIYMFLCVNVILTLCTFVWYHFKYRIDFLFTNLKLYANLLKSSVPFTLYALVTPIFMQIDILMLSRMSSYESVGLYSAAFKIFLSLIVIPNALRSVLFPSLSRLFWENKEKHIETFEMVFKYVILFVMPFSLIIFFLSDKIIYILYSKTFIESVVPLKIFSVMVLFYFLRSVCAVTLYSSHLEYRFICILMSGLVLNIILNLFLIPKWDVAGASISSLISEIMVFSVSYIVIMIKMLKTIKIKQFIKVGFAILLMCIFVFFSEKLSILSQIGLSIVIYLSWIAVFKVFRVNSFYLNSP
jgi:O-antigen/teichoic acid export membrane protein